MLNPQALKDTFKELALILYVAWGMLMILAVFIPPWGPVFSIVSLIPYLYVTKVMESKGWL